jgi:3-hydroxyacyl-CoA dehydrogenase
MGILLAVHDGRLVEGPLDQELLDLRPRLLGGEPFKALLAERGLLDYDAPIAEYWPAFAINGKARVTVRQVLTHHAGVPQIDRAVTDFGFPVGPFAMQDIAGIDVGARIRQHLRLEGRKRAEGPQSVIPDQLYEMGRYGQKTGAGWYRYETGSRTGSPDPLIDQLAEKAASDRGITRRAVSAGEIIERIMVALANEGANILDERIAVRPSDIDVIYVHGFGFPRHRGGPMGYADELGLPNVLSKVKDYQQRFGDYWQPAPLLQRLAAAGKGFYDFSNAALV